MSKMHHHEVKIPADTRKMTINRKGKRGQNEANRFCSMCIHLHLEEIKGVSVVCSIWQVWYGKDSRGVGVAMFWPLTKKKPKAILRIPARPILPGASQSTKTESTRVATKALGSSATLEYVCFDNSREPFGMGCGGSFSHCSLFEVLKAIVFSSIYAP